MSNYRQTKREIEWHNINGDDYESIGKHPLQLTQNDDYVCPTCNKPAEYDEGQIDQDFMGNDIYGWRFVCWDCGIASESTEGRWNSDDY